MATSLAQPLLTRGNQVNAGVTTRLRSARRIALFLDYDGTLTPIAPTPEMARIDPEDHRLLALLAQHPAFRLAIVTGRSLQQLRHVLPPMPADLAVNHGLRILRGRREWIHPAVRRHEAQLKRFVAGLHRLLKGFPGVSIEDKRCSVAVHFRNAHATDRPRIRNIVRASVREEGETFRIMPGKMVLEVRPAIAWSKGSAIRHFLASPRYRGSLAVFIGDDRTDEDGFEALAHDGITIRVGRSRRTRARYTLPDVRAVYRFLASLVR